MKQMLQFSATITNPAGIEWVIGSGAEVGSDLYMVAPVASASVPSPSALYQLDPATGEATILGGLGVVDPTDIAWDRDRSMMYLIDNDSDALYTVRQIQALSPSAPVASPGATGSYFPNAGDLYYNGGDLADAFLRWDNPRWKRDETRGSQCNDHVTKCSTYEHDLILDWSNDGGWFTVKRASQSFVDFGSTGVAEDDPDKAILSFGTYKAPLIVPGRDYYGYWSFKNLRGGMTPTSVSLYGQEGEYRRHPLVCPVVTKSNWCVFGIDGQQGRLTESSWIHGTPKYVYYTKP